MDRPSTETNICHIPAPPDPSRVVYSSHGTPFTVANSNYPQPVTKEEKKKCVAWKWVLGVIAAMTFIIVLLIIFLNPGSSEPKQFSVSPTSAPTSEGPEECKKKRIKITEICDVSDLDDDIFGDDKTMEIKILVNDQHYWPKQVETDCLEEYGYEYGQSEKKSACKIPDSSLRGCFPLRNSIELPFGLDGAYIEDEIKVTIYDVDFFSDDLIDVFVPKHEWYHPNLCEKREFEFRTKNGADGTARIKMVVDFGEVENPCGIQEDALISGLNDAAAELKKMQVALLEYVSQREPPERRNLIFGALVSGFRVLASGARSFVGLFTRSRGASNALSTVADMTQIGGLLVSLFGGDDNDSSNNNNQVNQALFDKVFDRFDQIDTQLDNIQVQIKDGFAAIKLVIQEEFAEQELDDWITFRLGIKLRGDYSGYMDRDHTALSRIRYEETFRDTCSGDYSPYNVFQVLYSHACLDCRRFSGKAQQYFLDTYVDLAKANFDNPMDRVLWFRRSFGTVIIGALTEAIYFYSVCLYRTFDECQVVDPVWDSRLEELGYALEEVVDSLGEAETRLE